MTRLLFQKPETRCGENDSRHTQLLKFVPSTPRRRGPQAHDNSTRIPKLKPEIGTEMALQNTASGSGCRFKIQLANTELSRQTAFPLHP